jgi:hypothetical protein
VAQIGRTYANSTTRLDTVPGGTNAAVNDDDRRNQRSFTSEISLRDGACLPWPVDGSCRGHRENVMPIVK